MPIAVTDDACSRARAVNSNPGASTEPSAPQRWRRWGSEAAIELAYEARARSWKLIRGAARALRPVLSEDAFAALYGLGRVGYLTRIERPRTFVEKLLWLKRHYRHPLMPQLVDKVDVREYVKAVAPELRFAELYAVSTSASDFPFAQLPDRAVLKPTHASGHVAFWRPGTDRGKLVERLDGWLKIRYHESLGEWFYEPLTPRILAEEDLSDEGGTPPTDYKVLVLNGRAEQVQVFLGRDVRLTRAMFDRDWRLVPAWRGARHGSRPLIVPDDELPPRPPQLEAMIAAAERLAAPFPFVRVDFYIVREELYFGEMTFMPSGGYVPLEPRIHDQRLGDLLELPGSPPQQPRATP